MPTDRLRHIHFSSIAVCLLFTTSTFSQKTTGCDLKFIDHLVKTGYFEEALFLIDSQDCSLLQMNDSIDYFRGWSLYSLNRLVPSSESLIKTTPSSSFYLKSHFYAAYNYTQTGNLDQATEALEEIEVTTKSLIALKNYEIAGIKLLDGNCSSFDEWFSKKASDQTEINDFAGNLLKISTEIKSHKSKSCLIAGLLSGIIPGSGKFYAGKKGEAVSAFLSTAGLGLVTWENYRKSGPNSLRTIAFGTVFAVSYMANIYGSVFSVRVIENEYKENVKSTILFNMHMPLSINFNK